MRTPNPWDLKPVSDQPQFELMIQISAIISREYQPRSAVLRH